MCVCRYRQNINSLNIIQNNVINGWSIVHVRLFYNTSWIIEEICQVIYGLWVFSFIWFESRWNRSKNIVFFLQGDVSTFHYCGGFDVFLKRKHQTTFYPCALLMPNDMSNHLIVTFWRCPKCGHVAAFLTKFYLLKAVFSIQCWKYFGFC